MTMPGQIVSTTDATTALIQQFEQTVAQQRQARTAMESCEAALNTQWGGQASGAYRNALAVWAQNLDQVRAALLELQTAMGQHARTNDTAEDDALTSVNIVAQQAAVSASWT
ncbi:WXG100 family type VII secretion target [Dactylosporangium sp. NPDC050688]|uniref:WXG100 family type VII secretion target n=1 Tax=Dactylosporangium sp. NPDC050688 TaxID=3157217 RepID=UPI0033CCD4ED